MQNIKHIIAVASGKGGVGKSTAAINLALSIKERELKVGILDADIYGPSVSLMLGVTQGIKPNVKEAKFFEPIIAKGIKTMSMSYLLSGSTPAVWRGPMASSALHQMMQQTLWGELDFLIVDLPPGTGDIHLTLSQKVKLVGAVIVTTPQDIALADVRKAIEMFGKVDVPIVGLIENMATFICNQCGCETKIFGSGGGEKLASEYGLPLLGTLPLESPSSTEVNIEDPQQMLIRSDAIVREFDKIVDGVLDHANRSRASDTEVVFE